MSETTGGAGATPAAIRTIEGGRRLSFGWLVVAVELLVILLVWQIAQGVLKVVNPIFLPPPSEIGQGILDLIGRGDLGGHLAASLSNFLTGYLSGVGLGVVLGLLIGGSLPLTRLAGPIVWALYAMPWIAIRPMTVIWFGFGNGPIIFLVFFSVTLPVLINTAAGVRTVDRSLLRAAEVFGAGRLATWRKITLPATVPFVLTGMRLGVVTGFIALLVSEIVGAPRGLGNILAVGASRFRTDDVFAVIFLIITLSVTSVWLVGRIERRVAAWRPQGNRR